MYYAVPVDPTSEEGVEAFEPERATAQRRELLQCAARYNLHTSLPYLPHLYSRVVSGRPVVLDHIYWLKTGQERALHSAQTRFLCIAEARSAAVDASSNARALVRQALAVNPPYDRVRGLIDNYAALEFDRGMLEADERLHAIVDGVVAEGRVR